MTDEPHEARAVSKEKDQKFLHSQNEHEVRSSKEIPENSKDGVKVVNAKEDRAGNLRMQTTQVISGESRTHSVEYNEEKGNFNVNESS